MKIHIEIGQFQFVEADADTVEGLKDIYLEVKEMFATEGVEHKDFNRITDEYLWEDKINADEYYALSDDQKNKIQWAKRSKARRKTK